MRNNLVLFLFACLCIFIGCLGGGGGGGLGLGTPTSPIPSSAVIYGKAFFPESSLYGSIPIIARDSAGLAMGSTRTDAYGNYSFSELAPGVYNLFATTGDTEVQFFTGAQVVSGSPVAVPEKELVELKDVVVDRITSTSFRVTFTSSQNCSSQVEYGLSVGPEELVAVNNTYVKDHQVTISGLTADSRYGVKVKLMTQDGQHYSYPAIYVMTTKANGPTNLALNIENGDMLTGFNSVRLYLSGENVSEMRIGLTENLDGQAWEGFANFREFSLPSGDGTKRVYAQFRDSFGNVSSVINDSIHLQSDRNGYIGVWINNGEGLTNERSVILSMLFPGATHMQVSDKSDFLNSFWEAYSVARKFQFSSEDGIKTIYVRFRGGQADENKIFSASIVLDTTGPEVTMKINNGALKTNNINLTLNFNPIQTPAYMQVEEDGTFDADSTWVKFSNPANFLVSKGDELKTVYARFKDELGNLFGPISAQIELDTTPPQNPQFNINNSEQTTDSIEVRLYISADEANYIMVSNSENFTGAQVERYKTIKNWSLAGYGVQSVYMQFIDDASNTTSALIQSIEVIGDPPASVTVAINQNDPSTANATASITLFAENVAKVRVGNHQNFSSLPDITYVANQPDGSMKIDNYSLDPVVGEKTVYVRFEETTGRFIVSNDTITLTGPGNYTITTLDTQPLSTYTVNLRLYAENATQMLITDDYLGLAKPENWVSFATNYAYALAKYPGKHTVYAKFRNDGRVETPPISLDVTVNETAPATPAIMINDGDAQTFASNVNIKVISNFYYPTMRLSNDGNFFNAADINSQDTPWSIPGKAGEATVYARFLHKDTGEFLLVQDSITAVGPTNTTISTSESLPLNKNWLVLNLFAVNATEMMISEDPAIEFVTSGWVPYQTSYNFALGDTAGNHSIYAKFRNAALNFIESTPVKLDVSVLAASPTGNSVAIRQNIAPDSTTVSQAFASELPVYLHFDVQDVNTATISYQIASAGMALPTTFNQIQAPGAPIALNYSDFNNTGVYNIYYKFADGVGNESALKVLAFEILEVLPNSSLAINDGDSSTQSPLVSLKLFSGNAVRYRISADGNFSSVADNPYIANNPDGSMLITNFNLEPVSGVKNLYARYESSSGQITFASDSITLVGPENYTLTTNDTQPLEIFTVNLRPFAENAAEMLITEDYQSLNNPALWQPFAYSVNFVLSSFSGQHTVYAKFRNSGNVETPAISLDVTVGESVSETPTFTINSGDAQTNRTAVQIDVSGVTDYPTMRISNDGNFFSAPDSASVDQPWFVSNQAGAKTVYVRFKHGSSGNFVTASDTITAVGPASATITTPDPQPMNKNWVNLDLFAIGASDMIISEDPNIANLNVGWVPYQTSMVFPLTNRTGSHIVYAKFRNAATNYIETVPVNLEVTVNSVSPSGNSATLRETAAIDATVVSEVAVGSLPVYLHFDILDANTATISWKIASSGASIPTTFNQTAAPVAPIPLGTGDFPGNGTFNIYYKFADGVGNETGLQVVSIKVLGPTLKISPASVAALKSGQTQQFNATLENVEGTVRWFITPSSPTSVYGSINTSTGLYTAPTTVSQNASFTVRAELLTDSSVNDTVDVELVTQVEIVVAQTNYQITKGDTTNITVRFRNSAQMGSVVSPTAGGGTAIMTLDANPAVPPTDTMATLTYTAPAILPGGTTLSDSVEITSLQDPSKKKILYFTVNAGPWVTITPESAQMRVKTGTAQFAANTSSDSATLYWGLPKGGWFDSAKTQNATTTTGNGSHLVTVYAPDTLATNPIEVVANFTEGTNVAEDRSPISLQSEVKITVTPKNQKLYLNDSSSLIFLAEQQNATTSEVIWEFKNATETTWVRADNYLNEDNGILTLNQGSGEYFAPASWPYFLGAAVNKINIRATSIDDLSASEAVTVELIQPLGVNIFDGYNNTYPNITNSSISVTLEVGNRQLFAEVGPVTDPTTNTNVNWFVQGVAGGNTIYGTIDSTGKFTAPDTAPQAAVTVRAVSVAQSTAFAETTVNLLDFWTPRSQDLKSTTNATFSVYCLTIDTTTPAGSNRRLFAGTNGHGAYLTQIAPSGSAYDWDSIVWQGFSGLSEANVNGLGKYVVNEISISLQDSDRLVAATNDGLYLLDGSNPAAPAVEIVGYENSGDRSMPGGSFNRSFTRVFSGVVIDPSDHTYMYALGKDQGVLRFIWSGATYVYSGTLYDDAEDRSYIKMEDRLWTPAHASATGQLTYQEPVLYTNSSGTMQFTTIEINPQNPNVLLVGFTDYLESRNPDVFLNGYFKISNARSSDYLRIANVTVDYLGDWSWSGGDPLTNLIAPGVPPGGQVTYSMRLRNSTVVYKFDNDSSIIHDIEIDPNTPTTIWLGKDNGIYRSTNDGNNYTQSGTYGNVRGIFIDPINTINVYIGTEEGLYRTKDAGTAWKQIKSGLEGNNTINSLGLTPGGLGNRRIFSGTTSGVFMGRTSLDLE